MARAVPTEAYCPRSTLRRPSRPENGARIAFCAITARVRSTVAAAESRAASAESTVDCGVLPPATSVFCRASVASAFLSWARPLARSACSTESSILIRRSPALTSPPEFEMDGGDDAGHLRRDDDALIGAQRADRGQLRRPLLDSGRLDRHRRRLRREGGAHEALDHVRLDDELEIGEPGGQRGEAGERHEEDDRPANPERQRADDEQRGEDGGGGAEGDRRGRRVQKPSHSAAPAASAASARETTASSSRVSSLLAGSFGSRRSVPPTLILAQARRPAAQKQARERGLSSDFRRVVWSRGPQRTA